MKSFHHAQNIYGTSGFVEITQKKIEISFYHQRSTTIHIDKDYFKSDEDIIYAIKLGLIKALIDNKFYIESDELLSDCVNSQLLIENSYFCRLALDVFIKTKNWSSYKYLFLNLIEYAQTLDDKEALLEICFYLNMEILNNLNIIPADVVEELRIALSKTNGEDKNAEGILQYNIGNAQRIKDLKKALYYYNKARKLRPAYLNSDYFLKELAGILFLLKKYKLSAVYYKKAFDLKNDKDILPLYADSLIFCGDYDSALNVLNGIKIEKIEWNLKQNLLEKLIIPKYNKQERKILVAGLELSNFDKKNKEQINDDEVLNDMEKVLSLDCINPLAWFNIGMMMNKLNMAKKETIFNADECFLAACLFNNDFFDGEALALAFVSGITDLTKTISIVRYAKEKDFNDFYEKLKNLSKNIQMDDKNLNEALIAVLRVKDIIDNEQTSKKSNEIRYLGENGEYISFNVE